MIDRKHQVKCNGRVALSKTLKEIRVNPAMNRISIRYMLENPLANLFHTIFCFIDVRRDRDDHMIAVLKL